MARAIEQDEYEEDEDGDEEDYPDAEEYPLHAATACADLEAMRLLLEQGAMVQARDKGRTEAVRLLLQHRAKVDEELFDKDCPTPLHMATRNGHLEVMRLLLDEGADVDAWNRVLEDIALTIQTQLVAKVPFCAFNGGNDVFVDVGNKLLGLEALMKYLQVNPAEVLHVGDRFTDSGNDVATRDICSVLWVANPEETGFFIKMLLKDIRKSRWQPYIE